MMRLTISRTVPGDFTIFILIVVLPVFLAFVKKLGLVSSFPVTKQLDELALVLLLPFALLGLIKLAAKTHTLLYLIFFGAYLVISSISAYASNVSAYQYLTQFVLELKFPLMLAILVAIADKEMFLGWVIVFGQAVLLVCIPFLFMFFCLMLSLLVQQSNICLKFPISVSLSAPNQQNDTKQDQHGD